MDNTEQSRSCLRERSASKPLVSGGSKQICIPMNREQYDESWEDTSIRSLGFVLWSLSTGFHKSVTKLSAY
jgi:hypothetical protein